MSIKKLLIVAIILALFTVGAVSAISVPDETNKLVEANGYTLVDDNSSSLVYNYTKGSDSILILYMFNYTISLDDLEDGFTEKTINNTNGFYKENGTSYLFHYPCGEDSVLIKATDPDVIEKIVLGNDP